MSALDGNGDHAGPDEVLEVLVALHPSFGALEVTGPIETLSLAQHKAGQKAFKFTICSETAATTSASGITFKADIDYEDAHDDLSKYDVLIVPGGPKYEEVLSKKSEPLKLIKAFAETQIEDPSKERSLLATYTASLFLAEAGLLQGLAATTHPDYYTKMEIMCKEAARQGQLQQTDVMEENYVVNNARFSIAEEEAKDENPFILFKRPDARRKSIARKGSNAWKDGKRRESIMKRAKLPLGGLRLITTGGVTSGMDASLYLIGALVSVDQAIEVSRQLQYLWQKGVTVEGIDV